MPLTLEQMRLIFPDVQDFLNFIKDSGAKIFFSQHGEDIAIFNLLPRLDNKMTHGFFVDVGAFHPTYYSNTKMLNILGWKGINVDANEASIRLFHQFRPNDINVFCGVGPEDGEMTYYKFKGGPVNTFCKESADAWKEANRLPYLGESTVQVRTINSILKENVPAGTDIDYMNIDIEGLDRAVLATLDFYKYRPSILTVELLDCDKLNLEADETVSYILGHYYKLMDVVGPTCVFLDRRFEKT